MAEKPVSDFDLRYLKGIYDDLSSSNRKQSDQIAKLYGLARETKALLEGYSDRQKEHGNRISDHEIRIRDVERVQASCKADIEITGIKKQLNRLVAFKDMILSKSNEDSQVIDVHAQRMKAAVESAMTQQVPWKILAWKALPWMIVVFAAGVVLATILATKMLSGEKVVLKAPGIEMSANSSSLGEK